MSGSRRWAAPTAGAVVGAVALVLAVGCSSDPGGEAVGAGMTTAPASTDASGSSSTRPPVPGSTTTAPADRSVARPTYVPDLVTYQREGDETSVPETSMYAIRYDGDRGTYLEVLTYHGDLSWVVEDPEAVPAKVGDLDAAFQVTAPDRPDEGLRVLAWYPKPDMYVEVVSAGPITEDELRRVAEGLTYEAAP